MLCRLKNCGKCGGDLVLDEADWRCVQCAQYYYGDTGERLDLSSNGRSIADPQGPEQNGISDSKLALAEPQPANDPAHGGESNGRKGRGRYGSRSSKSIDSFVQAKGARETGWLDRNKDIIEYLEKGLSTREISQITDRGLRHVRMVRERLAEVRAAAGGF